MRQVVVDRFRHTDANDRVAHLLGDLRHLPRGVHRVVAAVVKEIADVVRLEHLDQALVLGLVLLQALQLVTAGTEGAARRMAQAGNIRLECQLLRLGEGRARAINASPALQLIKLPANVRLALGNLAQ